jgi:hypothetical protein
MTICISKPFIQINREYRITSKELKKAMEIEGEIQDLGLHSGRSPNDIENKISADKDIWYIHTVEIKMINQTKNNAEPKDDVKQ